MSRELAELVVRRAREDELVAQLIFDEGGLDIAACEAAGLAHDLGHAPFGHAGETELHNLLRDRTADGFEGNPQSFRIVTRLEGRTFARKNMRLTNVTLCAILKYPWNREDAKETEGDSAATTVHGGIDHVEEVPTESESPDNALGPRIVEKPEKYGAYEEDREQYEIVRRRVMGDDYASNRRQSLEASVMDLADDIAYAIHDLEDFCTAGMIDLHAVASALADATIAVKDETSLSKFELSTSPDPFTKATTKLRRTYRGLFDDNQYYLALERVDRLIDKVFDSSSGETFAVVLRHYLSGKIGEYFGDLDINTNLPYKRAGYVRLSPAHWHEVQVLKVITRHWLIQSPQMGVIQRAQTRAIRTLFYSLEDWLRTTSTEAASLPEALHSALTDAGVNLNDEKFGNLDARHYRAIGDYIGSLSDSEALLRSNWFAGREIPGMTVVAETQ